MQRNVLCHYMFVCFCNGSVSAATMSDRQDSVHPTELMECTQHSQHQTVEHAIHWSQKPKSLTYSWCKLRGGLMSISDCHLRVVSVPENQQRCHIHTLTFFLLPLSCEVVPLCMSVQDISQVSYTRLISWCHQPIQRLSHKHYVLIKTGLRSRPHLCVSV